jgi:hypothetical protein
LFVKHQTKQEFTLKHRKIYIYICISFCQYHKQKRKTFIVL